MALRRVKPESREQIEWGAQTDVGLVRGHNEDAYVNAPPLFAVCDGMGGHEAGEVASAIAVDVIEKNAPITLDDAALGAAIEAANAAIMNAAEQGVGKPGMGCTATAAMIVGEKMAVAHVGDSRCYLLRAGQIVRVTHDHSYVEELVDAGEITADEARVHPARSIITRALGSDPDLYADHFTLDVEKGDRIILCSDGLSSMCPDEQIEDIAVSTTTAQKCADALVQAALFAGGYDNVTVVVVDVARDVAAERHARELRRRVLFGALAAAAVIALAFGGLSLVVKSSYFVGTENGNVAIFRGMNGDLFGMNLYELNERTDVNVDALPDATRKSLEEGIAVSSQAEAVATVDSYREQIDTERAKAAEDAEAASSAEPDTGATDTTTDEARPLTSQAETDPATADTAATPESPADASAPATQGGDAS